MEFATVYSMWRFSHEFRFFWGFIACFETVELIEIEKHNRLKCVYQNEVFVFTSVKTFLKKFERLIEIFE